MNHPAEKTLLAPLALAAALVFSSFAFAEPVRIRVVGAQIPVTEDVARNLETITRAIDFAAREKADVLVTPEGSLSGYYAGFDGKATRQALETVVQRAKAAKLALVLGTCFEAEDGRRYNAQRFYDKDGRYLGYHAKILLCRRMSDPAAKAEVDSFQSRPLRTFNLFGLTTGGLICNDMWANPEYTPMDDPYLARRLADMGADLIFVSAFTGRGVGDSFALSRAFHESNLRMRARGAKRWVVSVNAADAAGEKGLHAPSGVIAPDGTWVKMITPSNEQFFVHDLAIEPRAADGAN